MRMFKNRRGLSPIFATLILIAIAVIAGIVVYAFSSGFIGGLTTGTNTGSQKMSVQAASVTGLTAPVVTAYCQSTAGGPITLDSALLKDSSNNVIGSADAAAITLSGTTTTPAVVTTSLTAVDAAITFNTGITTLVSGNTYSITLISTTGGTFVGPSFTAP